MKDYIEDWKESLNIDVRFNWATEKQKKQIFAEIVHQRRQGELKGMKDTKNKTLRGVLEWAEKNAFEGEYYKEVDLDDLKDHIKKELNKS